MIVALGSTYAGLMCNDEELAEQIIAAGERTGEIVWRLPLHAEYDELIKGTYADLDNAPEARKAGTIIGAAFLSNFVGETPWAHLDIAGSAWDLGRAYVGKGASGLRRAPAGRARALIRRLSGLGRLAARRVEPGRGTHAQAWSATDRSWRGGAPASPSISTPPTTPTSRRAAAVPAPGPARSTVLIHGGRGKRYGKIFTRGLAGDLRRRGFAVWHIEYRRVGADGDWPNTFEDVARGGRPRSPRSKIRGWTSTASTCSATPPADTSRCGRRAGPTCRRVRPAPSTDRREVRRATGRLSGRRRRPRAPTAAAWREASAICWAAHPRRSPSATPSAIRSASAAGIPP